MRRARLGRWSLWLRRALALKVDKSRECEVASCTSLAGVTTRLVSPCFDCGSLSLVLFAVAASLVHLCFSLGRFLLPPLLSNHKHLTSGERQLVGCFM